MELTRDMSGEAYRLYIAIANGLGFVQDGQVKPEIEDFLLGVNNESASNDNWISKSSSFEIETSEGQSIESVLISDINSSQHGKYVGQSGRSVLEAFLCLQWRGIMNDYAKRLESANLRGEFQSEFDGIKDEIKSKLVPRSDNGIFAGALVNSRGTILDGNNRLIKLKLFLAMEIANIQFDNSLSKDEKATKMKEKYEEYRVEVVRQQSEDEYLK